MLTSWQDMANAGFEAGAVIAVLAHCHRLHQDKEVRGYSALAVGFFVVWGFWNLYYYPHLNQLSSFLAGLAVTAANLLYAGLLITYSRDRWAQWIKRQLVCRFKGHRSDAHYFTTNCLYPCARCGDEIFGRGWDDIEPLSDEEFELNRQMDEVYGSEGRR